MKKITRQLAVIAMSVILAVILCFSFACAPQGNDGDNTLKKQSEIAGFNLPHSAGQASDEFYDYNSKLFYLNETRISGADPGAAVSGFAPAVCAAAIFCVGCGMRRGRLY